MQGLDLTKSERDGLCLSLSRLVRSVVNKIGKSNYDDLYQAGMVGALCAIDKYDPLSGVKLSSYAVHWIRKEIMLAIQDQRAKLIGDYKTAQVVADFRKFECIDAVCDKQAGKVSRTTIEAIVAQLKAVDVRLGGDIEETDYLIDRSCQPEEICALRSEAALLMRAVGSLDDKKRDVIRRRYFGDRVEPHASIGMSYGVTGQSIRLIEKAAIADIQHYMKNPR